MALVKWGHRGETIGTRDAAGGRTSPPGKTSRETVYAITSMTSARVTTQDLARLVREHWSVEASTTSGTWHSMNTPPPATPAATRQLGYYPRRHHRCRLPACPRRPAWAHHPAEALHLHGLD